MRNGVLALSLLAASSTVLWGQGSMHRQTAATVDRDAEGHMKTTPLQGEQSVHGVVVLPDGAPPTEVIEVVATCSNVARSMAVPDSKGRYSFSFNPNRALDASMKDCQLKAVAEGCRSNSVALSGDKPAKLVLQQNAAQASGLTSEARGKTYDKALTKAAKHDWEGAIAELQEALSGTEATAAAWLNLGVLQQIEGRNSDAKKAYLAAARLDAKFAVPFLRAAALEAAQGDLQAAAAHSQEAIRLNADAFPDAYAWNALANAGLGNTSEAEASARRGLRLDTTHSFPELEYALGLALSAKDDRDGAREQFTNYLKHAPGGPNAAAAQTELARMQAADQMVAHRQAAEPFSNSEQEPVPLANPNTPALAAVQERNAPFLKKAPSTTCLESVARTVTDQQGKVRSPDVVRAEIAVSEGKEIYDEADGKRFQDNRQWDVLGYSFSTTGLFHSIGRALIAGNRLQITPLGQLERNGETLFRYDFRTVPGAEEWAIHYGKESGHAGEQGWFLVDSQSLLLRTVYVSTYHLPGNLKFVRLSALIDYEVETINGERTLLPQAGKVQLDERSGVRRTSRISFDHCHAFGADSTLSFDVPAPQNAVQAERPRLPVGKEITISLTTPLSETTVNENDVITGTVKKAVSWNGREMIPSGAAIEGHAFSRRGNRLLLEFDRVQTRAGWAPFYAQLTSLFVPGQSPRIEEAQVASEAARGRTADPEDDGKIEPFHIPGAAAIVTTGAQELLPAGTLMIWKTEGLEPQPAKARVPQLDMQMGLR